jgi:hypothetical protein
VNARKYHQTAALLNNVFISLTLPVRILLEKSFEFRHFRRNILGDEMEAAAFQGLGLIFRTQQVFVMAAFVQEINAKLFELAPKLFHCNCNNFRRFFTLRHDGSGFRLQASGFRLQTSEMGCD